MKRFIKSQIATAILMSIPLSASAFQVIGEEEAGILADQLVLGSSGVSVTSSSINFGVANGPGEGIASGPDNGFTPFSQSGLFTNEDHTYGLPGPGVILSTGNVEDFNSGVDQNVFRSSSAGNAATAEQNTILQSITGKPSHFDPVELNITFDVDDTVDKISFFATFGSEEFPDFVNTPFTDGFGMFLNGVNVAGALPTGGKPGVDPLLPINIDHPDMAAVPGTALNGVLAPNGLPVVRFDVPVTPGSTGNAFSVILADTSDSVFDTTIYLSSFGNFSATDGTSEFTPILPDESNPVDAETGGFVFDLPPVTPSEIIWIDPDVATGYVYTATGGGLFASVTAPNLVSVNDADGYEITYINGSGTTVTVALGAGDTFFFDHAVATFELNGINTDLLLDPTNPLAFVTGLSFSTAGSFGVIQTPVTQFVGSSTVPEPSVIALFGLGIFGLGIVCRRQKS